MNAVGIDVSKGKSMVCIMRPFGEVVQSPFEVMHTGSELNSLAKRLKSLRGETKIIMEYTGRYYEPVAFALHKAGLFVSAVHAQLIHDYGNDTIRKVKTDKADTVKIANYGLSAWLKLQAWRPEEDLRRQLKVFSRQYNKYSKQRTVLINNFIALTDQTFPGVNELFTPQPRKSDGHLKWVDFTARFWHCECINNSSLAVFEKRYLSWCKKSGYRFSKKKSAEIYAAARECCCALPKDDVTNLLIQQAVKQLNAASETLFAFAGGMLSIAQQLPEWPVASAFYGVGALLGPQLMAEIGDVRRFPKKGSLVCFAGLEAPPYSSGKFESKECKISKQGSPHLRKTLFQIMDIVLKNAPPDDPIYKFLDRKRTEKSIITPIWPLAAPSFCASIMDA